MDLSTVRAICDAALPCMASVLQVGHHRISLDYGAPDVPDSAATIEINAAYHRYDITIDPAEADDEAEALDALRHELIHVVHAEFDLFAIGEGVGTDGYLWEVACERTVRQIERILDGLGWTPVAMAGRETTCAGCSHTWRAAAPVGTESVECPCCSEKVTHGRV